VRQPSAGLLDTSVFIAREQRRRLKEPPLHASVSVITVGELHLGVLAAEDQETRTLRSTSLGLVRSMEAVPVTEWVMDEWARLVDACRQAGLLGAIKRMDSFIAATAVTLGVPVVTQDDDYDRMAAVYPALTVMKV
jgi:predicted nucleic acid-binding protein